MPLPLALSLLHMNNQTRILPPMKVILVRLCWSLDHTYIGLFVEGPFVPFSTLPFQVTGVLVAALLIVHFVHFHNLPPSLPLYSVRPPLVQKTCSLPPPYSSSRICWKALPPS
ncbi:hypothetical protein PIB30_075589 [Stylosanthes scabra]|uniref:Uncharacterized protein n=1 Tax=Stylosanthes scabra TaxID=79078 RepID=A0ABU6YNT9_9FABA|nr:hypothetical protein [Stylosanthes scabra]